MKTMEKYFATVLSSLILLDSFTNAPVLVPAPDPPVVNVGDRLTFTCYSDLDGVTNGTLHFISPSGNYTIRIPWNDEFRTGTDAYNVSDSLNNTDVLCSVADQVSGEKHWSDPIHITVNSLKKNINVVEHKVMLNITNSTKNLHLGNSSTTNITSIEPLNNGHDGSNIPLTVALIFIGAGLLFFLVLIIMFLMCWWQIPGYYLKRTICFFKRCISCARRKGDYKVINDEVKMPERFSSGIQETGGNENAGKESEALINSSMSSSRIPPALVVGRGSDQADDLSSEGHPKSNPKITGGNLGEDEFEDINGGEKVSSSITGPMGDCGLEYNNKDQPVKTVAEVHQEPMAAFSEENATKDVFEDVVQPDVRKDENDSATSQCGEEEHSVQMENFLVPPPVAVIEADVDHEDTSMATGGKEAGDELVKENEKVPESALQLLDAKNDDHEVDPNVEDSATSMYGEEEQSFQSGGGDEKVVIKSPSYQ